MLRILLSIISISLSTLVVLLWVARAELDDAPMQFAVGDDGRTFTIYLTDSGDVVAHGPATISADGSPNTSRFLGWIGHRAIFRDNLLYETHNYGLDGRHHFFGQTFYLMFRNPFTHDDVLMPIYNDTAYLFNHTSFDLRPIPIRLSSQFMWHAETLYSVVLNPGEITLYRGQLDGTPERLFTLPSAFTFVAPTTDTASYRSSAIDMMIVPPNTEWFYLSHEDTYYRFSPQRPTELVTIASDCSAFYVVGPDHALCARRDNTATSRPYRLNLLSLSDGGVQELANDARHIWIGSGWIGWFGSDGVYSHSVASATTHRPLTTDAYQLAAFWGDRLYVLTTDGHALHMQPDGTDAVEQFPSGRVLLGQDGDQTLYADSPLAWYLAHNLVSRRDLPDQSIELWIESTDGQRETVYRGSLPNALAVTGIQIAYWLSTNQPDPTSIARPPLAQQLSHADVSNLQTAKARAFYDPASFALSAPVMVGHLHYAALLVLALTITISGSIRHHYRRKSAHTMMRPDGDLGAGAALPPDSPKWLALVALLLGLGIQ